HPTEAMTDLTTSRPYESPVIFKVNGKEIGRTTVKSFETPIQTVRIDLEDMRDEITHQLVRYKDAKNNHSLLLGYDLYTDLAKAFPLTADNKISDEKWTDFTDAFIYVLKEAVYAPYLADGLIEFKYGPGEVGADLIKNTFKDFRKDPFDEPASA